MRNLFINCSHNNNNNVHWSCNNGYHNVTVLYQNVGELIHLASFNKKTEIVKKLIEKYNVDPNLVSEVVSWSLIIITVVSVLLFV